MLQRFFALLATTLGPRSRFRSLSPGGGSRISRRPNFTPPCEAPLQQTCPGEQGRLHLVQPLTATTSTYLPSLLREAVWGTAARTPAAAKGGPCPGSPPQLIKGTPEAPPHPKEERLWPGCAAGCEGAAMGGRRCSCCSGRNSSSSCTSLPFPSQVLWHSKIRQKVSYLSSFLLLAVNALENLPAWLVLRVSSTQAIPNPNPSKY